MPVAEKVLNSNLVKKKKQLQKLGWRIDFNESSKEWKGERKFKNKDIIVHRKESFALLYAAAMGSEEENKSAATVVIGPGGSGLSALLAKETSPDVPYRELPLDVLVPSDTDPQNKRREGFTQEELEEFAVDIKANGVLQPIVVRQLPDGTWQIVCGERRWRSSKIAGLEKIPVIVHEYTDREVLKIQWSENTRRKNPHAMFVAYYYGFLRDELELDEKAIALEVGKPLAEVRKSLKLLELHEDVRNAFESKRISYEHVQLIAPFKPVEQPAVLKLAFYNSDHSTQALYTSERFGTNIDKFYLRRLSQAPFSLTSTELRSDGIACVKCPETTGAQKDFFSDGAGKNDSCLNAKCWEAKDRKNVEIARQNVVVEKFRVSEEKAPEMIKKVPIITTDNYVTDKVKDQFTETITGAWDYKILKTLNDCGKAIEAVFAHGTRNGQKAIICKKSSNCPKHWGGSSSKSNSNSPAKDEATLERESLERRNRKEEIIDCNVGEIVRREVLKQIAGSFDAENTIFNHPLAADYLEALTEKLWKFQCNYNEDNAAIIRKAMGVSEKRLFISSFQDNLTDQLTADEKSRLLWLILHVDIEKMFEGADFKPQRQIRDLADGFGVDYRMIDAAERLKYASVKHEKHAKEFHNYLVKLENGDRSAQIPRVYSKDYRPKE